MPKRLEDVLNQRRLKRNVMFSLSRYRDDVCETKRLVQILANVHGLGIAKIRVRNALASLSYGRE